MFKRKPKSDKPAKAAKPAKPAKAAKEKPVRAKKAARVAGPVVKKPSDIYTVLLGISLAAVLIACTMLFLELSSYGSFPWWNAS